MHICNANIEKTPNRQSNYNKQFLIKPLGDLIFVNKGKIVSDLSVLKRELS